MILLGLFIFVFSVQLSRTVSLNRKILALIAFVFFFIGSSFDFYWLVDVNRSPFHPSDPSNYYNDVIGLTLPEVFQIESSNTFYFLVNWLGWFSYGNPYVVSVLLKLTNIFVFLSAYLLLTKKLPRLTCIDYLLLFNPYTLMTLVRNVRDMYIVLFSVMILIGIGIIQGNKLNLFWTFLAVVLMSLTRAVMLIPLFIVFFEKNKHRLSRFLQYTVYIMGFLLVIVFSREIIYKVGNQMISALISIGEDGEMFQPLLEGDFSFALLKTIFIRLAIGFVSFLFTPHPFNFISKWFSTMDWNGMSGIYTGTDNFLIALGSVFNYVFVIPLILFFCLNYKKVNRYFFLFVICYVLLYVISYMGVSDIRNRNTAIFFVLSGILFSNVPLHLKKIHYWLTFGIFCGILFLGRL